MNVRKFLSGYAVAACMIGAVSSTTAQAALDADSAKVYGGTYLSDCKNPASPRVIVQTAALLVQKDNQRMSGGNLQAAHSYFGQSPPPHYLVALLSEVRGGLELQAIVYRDKSGQYLTLDGAAKVRAGLGPRLLAYKYRLCDSARSQPEPARSTQPAKKYALTELSAPGLLYDAKIKTIYYQALGAKRKTSWLAQLDGPSPNNKKVKVGGAEYILASACKNHDCAEHNVVLLYAQGQERLYGKIYEGGRVTYIGQPSSALRADLDRLWKSEWRQRH